MDKADNNPIFFGKKFSESVAVITDCEIGQDDYLYEYLNIKNIVFDILPKNLQGSIVNYLLTKYKKDKLLIIFDQDNLKKIFRDPQFPIIKSLASKDKVKIVLGGGIDTVYNLRRTLYQDQWSYEEIVSAFNSINIDCFADGIPDTLLQDTFKQINFNFVSYPLLSKCHIAESDIYSDHSQKTHKFFSLLQMRDNKRLNRQWFFKGMLEKSSTKDIILQTNENTPKQRKEKFADLQDNYGSIWCDQIAWLDSVPVIDLYNKTFFEVAAECVGSEPIDDHSFHPTEKVWKPIIMKHPFIMLASRHFLRHLRAIGFKTFESLINQSYDDIQDNRQRTEAVIDLVSGFTFNQAKDFYFKSRDICEHNHAHFLNLRGRYKYDKWKKLDQYFYNLGTQWKTR